MIHKYIFGGLMLAFAGFLSACSNASSENHNPIVHEEDFSINDFKPPKASAYSAEENTLTDSRDGKIYKTVKIGNQLWMAENLNYVTANSNCYNRDTINCSIYGRLYPWATAMGKTEEECGYGATCGLTGKIQGICPSGWHIPTKYDFDFLFYAIGDWTIAGPLLKHTFGWNNDGNGMNTFGFSALPAGYRYVNGHFLDQGNIAFFWSSEEDGSYWAGGMSLHYIYNYASISNEAKSDGFSVRCLKD